MQTRIFMFQTFCLTWSQVIQILQKPVKIIPGRFAFQNQIHIARVVSCHVFSAEARPTRILRSGSAIALKYKG